MTDVVLPHQLSTLLDQGELDFDLLSLDCFDTLIWRNVNMPRDVFHDLGIEGVGAHQRVVAEQRARDRSRLSSRTDEVSIEAIYREVFPGGGEATVAAGVAAELAAEARHCYAFRPTVELMRAAKRQGRTIVIVSDTYLNAGQLGELIRRAAGDEVADLIDRIFCSSEYGMSKAGGLFGPVLRALRVKRDRILHIGDNKGADLDAPLRHGMQARHIKQFDEPTRERLRLETNAAVMFTPATRATMPAFQPHRPALAMAQERLSNPIDTLGYATLGPIFYGFGSWLQAEADALSADGRPTRLVFLLRDGYLPKLVFDAMATGRAASTAQISRFTAIASSFATEQDVLDYVERVLPSTPTEVVAMQLLFEDGEIRRLLAGLTKGAGEKAAFVRAIQKPRLMHTILQRSKAMADGLVAHIKAQTGAVSGDRLVLVDLGYAGSVQNYVEPLLRRELGVEISGRYLLLREHDSRGDDKRGMIDRRSHDNRALNAMCRSVAVVEQLSTVAMGSVVGYGPDGTPRHADNVIKGRQSQVRSDIQDACAAFARDCLLGFETRPASEVESWMQAAAATLARLMFLPIEEELAALSLFEHDVNLGTDQSVRLFDADHATRELKRRGPFYINGVDRMYLPAELRGQGLPLGLTLLTGWRFELDLKQADFHDRTIKLPIIVADGNSMTDSEVEAFPTHDGYFVASIPVGTGRYAIGLKFGTLFEWLQIEDVGFQPQSRVGASKDSEDAMSADCLLEGIEMPASNLLHCREAHGFMLVPPPAAREPMVLNVAFRPVLARSSIEPAPPPEPSEALVQHA